MLKEGDKVLIAHRRLFEKDLARFFIGTVAAFDGALVKVVGYSYSPDLMNGQIIKKAERRTKLLSLASGTILFYVLPDDVAIDEVWFVTEASHMTAMDGRHFTMNMTELSHSRHL